MVGANNENSYDTIGALLAKSATRRKGLSLLKQQLPCVPPDELEQRAPKWLEFSLNACNRAELNKYAELIYANLGMLAEQSAQSPQLTKTFTNSHLPRLLESLDIVSKSGYLPALQCIEICVRVYPGPCSPLQGRIDRFVRQFVDSQNIEIVRATGRCLLQMQNLRSKVKGCESAAMRWKNHQLTLLGSLYSLLAEHYGTCDDLANSPLLQLQFELEPLVELEDPVQQARQVFNRFRNLMEFLKIAICGSFPVAKSIYCRKLLNFIARILSTTASRVQNSSIFAIGALNAVLPDIHIAAYELLDALLLVLKRALLQYPDIFPMFTDTLKWTSKKHADVYVSLRTTAYGLVQRCCETFAVLDLNAATLQVLLQEINKDISPQQRPLFTNALKLTKTKKRKTLSLTNEATAFPNNAATSSSRRPRCIAALRCLQALIVSSINFNAFQEKRIHESTSAIVEHFTDSAGLYAFWQCRLEVYKLVHMLATTPTRYCLSAAQLALNCLQRGQLHDKDHRVRLACAAAIRAIECYVHPKKETLIFPIHYDEYEFTQHMLASSQPPETVDDDEDEEEEEGECAIYNLSELQDDTQEEESTAVEECAPDEPSEPDTEQDADSAEEQETAEPELLSMPQRPVHAKKRSESPNAQEASIQKKPRLVEQQPTAQPQEALSHAVDDDDDDEHVIEDLMSAFVG